MSSFIISKQMNKDVIANIHFFFCAQCLSLLCFQTLDIKTII